MTAVGSCGCQGLAHSDVVHLPRGSLGRPLHGRVRLYLERVEVFVAA
jgi:hypothetical protein